MYIAPTNYGSVNGSYSALSWYYICFLSQKPQTHTYTRANTPSSNTISLRFPEQCAPLMMASRHFSYTRKSTRSSPQSSHHQAFAFPPATNSNNQSASRERSQYILQYTHRIHIWYIVLVYMQRNTSWNWRLANAKWIRGIPI